jgi:hypothetical protein
MCRILWHWHPNNLFGFLWVTVFRSMPHPSWGALNCRKPLKVSVDCSEEEFSQLLITFQQFLAE